MDFHAQRAVNDDGDGTAEISAGRSVVPAIAIAAAPEPPVALATTRSRTRKRLVWAGGILCALALYFASVLWLGHGLAEDVRRGMHELDTSAVFPERRR